MTKNHNECCANCKLCKTLWWWVYKADGMIDHKQYGNVCTALAYEDCYMKLDSTDGMCECFESEENTKK